MARFWKGSANNDKLVDRELLRDFALDDRAATSIEYALIAVILSGCLIVALPLVSTELAGTFTSVAGYFVTILGG